MKNYGYTNKELIIEMSEKICSVLYYSEEAVKLLVETANKETKLGNYTDSTIGAGMGLCQFDKKPFYWVRHKSINLREKIINELGVDIKLVEWEHLRYNPFLSLLFCRLYYLKITIDAIPDTLEGRAKYWKKYYNSVLGKGTVEQYIKANKGLL